MTDLDVEFQGHPVGRAITDDSMLRFGFRYDPEWLDRTDAFPISAHLPLRSEPWPASHAHAFFANLLPEGAAREAVCDRLGISPDNDVELLAALGDDTAGALRFLSPTAPSGHQTRDRRLISTEQLEAWAEGAPAFSSDSDRPPRLSLAGAQHKTSVVQTAEGWALPASGEPSTHILKFDSPRFPHLTVNEHLTTRFAAELGLSVVSSELDHSTSPPFLVVERYDRHADDGAVQRIHQEDFCQVTGVMPSRKYESEGGPGLTDVGHSLRRLSSQPAADRLELLRWVICCVVAGNADGHGKNLSMLYHRDGRRLAPAYDLVCTRAFPNISRHLAMAVGGRRDADRLLREHWERCADDLEVRPRLVFRELDRILEKAPDALEAAIDQTRDHLSDAGAIPQISQTIRKQIRAVGSHL